MRRLGLEYPLVTIYGSCTWRSYPSIGMVFEGWDDRVVVVDAEPLPSATRRSPLWSA